jgi:hypothetical protein
MKDGNMNKNCSTDGDIEAWCPICKQKSGHTIITIFKNSPKRIKCNACDEHHNLSAKSPGENRTKTKSLTRKSRSKEATYQEYLSRLTGGDPANSIKYNIKGNFKKDEIIDHLSFGIGIVLSVNKADKIRILFKDGPRLLIQNQ